MKFTISTIYASADCEFEISSKVPKLIAKKVNQCIFPQYQLDTLKPEWLLSVIITTDSKKIERKVCEAEIFEKEKNENYVAWIPYYSVVNEEKNQIQNYFEEVFEALSLVLANYQVDKEVLMSLKKEILSSVLSNPTYIYKPKFKPDLNVILEKVNEKHKVTI